MHFLSNISYPRAIASCLPGIGILVTACNLIEVKMELNNIEVKERLMPFNLLYSPEEVAAQQREKAELKERHIAILRASIDYFRCAIVHHLLSIATLVTLLALGFFSSTLPILLTCALLSFAAYRFNNLIAQDSQKLSRLSPSASG